MASIIGDALVWLLGNHDALTLFIKFALGLGFLYSVLMVWKTVEGSREDERF